MMHNDEHEKTHTLYIYIYQREIHVFSGFHILFTQQLSIQPGSRNHNSGVLTDALAQGQASLGPGEGNIDICDMDMEDMWDSTIKNEDLSL